MSSVISFNNLEAQGPVKGLPKVPTINEPKNKKNYITYFTLYWLWVVNLQPVISLKKIRKKNINLIEVNISK